VLGTLFHHAAATTLAIGPVPITVVEPTILAALVTKTPLAKTPAPRFGAASHRAVPIAAVAPRAEEEHLPAPQPPADHEPKRLHVPERGTGENLFNRPDA